MKSIIIASALLLSSCATPPTGCEVGHGLLLGLLDAINPLSAIVTDVATTETCK